MRFLSSKYTKMLLVGKGLAAPPLNTTPALDPAGLEFLALGLKEVVHPWSK